MYLNIILTKFKESCAYRTEFIGGIASSVVSLVSFWFIWSAIYNSAGVATLQGLTLTTMITYISISTVIRLYSYSYSEHMIHDEVKYGGIAVAITKPMNYIFFVLAREIGSTLYNFIVRGLPILLIAFLILNITFTQVFIPFTVSMMLGFLVNFFLILLVGLWSFWAGTIWGLRYSKMIIAELTSGAIIPLFLFPSWFQTIAGLLPFQSIYHIPISIYIGKIAGFEIVTSILIQIFWVAALGMLSLGVWKLAQRRIYVQGG